MSSGILNEEHFLDRKSVKRVKFWRNVPLDALR